MLQTTPSSPGLLFCSFLYRQDRFSETVLVNLWSSGYGPSIHFTPTFNPLFEYYSHEMGSRLARVFVISSELRPRTDLLRVKIQALEWERRYAEDNKRTLNMDIGFLSPENFLLATTKNYAHRVYLAQNIYAELTYQTVDGNLEPLPWTYPDYRDQEKLEFFLWLRSYLLQKLATLPK